jgi:hypothetical protein
MWFIFLGSGSFLLLEHEILPPIDTQDPTRMSPMFSDLELYGSFQESSECRECSDFCIYIESPQASLLRARFLIQWRETITLSHQA